ncbi:MAG: type IV pilin protein [Gammaproteobacteria bacterium]|nr:type IV pilin protein [Gammaproteobacteria bacterium]
MRKNMRGITLMELMIVVVIVGILAAVAFPNYRNFVARAGRSEAKGALLRCATNQEKFYLQNQIFTDSLIQLGFDGPPFQTDSGKYSIAVSSPPSPNNFTCTATYLVADNEAGKCLTFTIDGRGSKTSGPDTDCWTRTR